jgi:hypothetical protein
VANKKATYGLLVLVALIWGGVIYRFFNFVGDDDNLAETSDSFQVQEIPKFQKDSFQLHKGFRDPFLGGISHGSSNVSVAVQRPVSVINIAPKPTQIIPQLPSEPFPEVQHLGIVNNGTSGTKTHMVVINGNKYMISKLGKYANVEVTELSKDYIKLKFNNEVKIFRP